MVGNRVPRIRGVIKDPVWTGITSWHVSWWIVPNPRCDKKPNYSHYNNDEVLLICLNSNYEASPTQFIYQFSAQTFFDTSASASLCSTKPTRHRAKLANDDVQFYRRTEINSTSKYPETLCNNNRDWYFYDTLALFRIFHHIKQTEFDHWNMTEWMNGWMNGEKDR